MTRPLLADYYVPRHPRPVPAARPSSTTERARRVRRDAAQRQTDAATWAARNYGAEPVLPPAMAGDLRTLLALIGQALAEHDRASRMSP